jgi:hypothetical protein
MTDIGVNDGATIMAVPSLLDRVQQLEQENLQLADHMDRLAETVRGFDGAYPGSEVLDGDQRIRAAALIVAKDQIHGGRIVGSKVDALDLVDVADYIVTGRRWRDDVPDDDGAVDEDVDGP